MISFLRCYNSLNYLHCKTDFTKTIRICQNSDDNTVIDCLGKAETFYKTQVVDKILFMLKFHMCVQFCSSLYLCIVQ